MVPAVPVKVLVVAPAFTTTDAGTVRRALLLLTVTVSPPLGAVPESVMVQVVAAPVPRLDGTQANELTVGFAAATSEIDDVFWTPLNVAVTVAVWLLPIVPAVAVKVAVVALAETATEPGTVNAALLLDSETVPPPVPLIVTVQVDVPPEFRLPGAHDTLLSVGGAPPPITMLPPEPDAVMATPFGSAADTLDTAMFTVPDALPESVTVTTAATPFAIAF